MPNGREELKKKQTPEIADFSGGEQPDTELVDPPAWLKLKNLWIDSAKKAHGRPHEVHYSQEFSSINGLGISHENKLLYVADGTLYQEFTPLNAITGSGRISYDVSRDRTVITAGGKPMILPSLQTIDIDNVKSVATFVGAQKLRLALFSTDDKRKIQVSTIGNLTDFGTIITDSKNINDEWTEGRYIKNLPYELLDLTELNNGIFVATRRYLGFITPELKEEGFWPVTHKNIDYEVLDVQVRQDGGQVFFLTPQGPFRFFFDQGQPAIDKIPLVGIERTIINSIVESEARLGIDSGRGLLLLKCSDSSPAYAYHFAHKLWTEWDIPFIDVAEIGKDLYVASGSYVNRLDDTIEDTDSPYEIIIHSGLTGLGDNLIRKRIRSIGADFVRPAKLEYYFESFADSIPSTITPTYSGLEDGVKRVIGDAGDQGERNSIYLAFKNYGKFDLGTIWLDMFLKRPRIR